MSMTINEPSSVDEETLTVTRTIRIAASIDKVWSAITEPAHISKWFGETALDGRGAGATGTITFPDFGSVPLRVEAIDEPRMVSYRWGNDDAAESRPEAIDEETTTVFTFTLEPAGDHTQLTVVETGFERTSSPLANLRDHGQGWTDELNKLVALLESTP